MENHRQLGRGERFIDGTVRQVLLELDHSYLVIGNSRVRGWHAWLAIGLIVGFVTGVFLIANRSGAFIFTSAAGNAVALEAESASLIGPVTIGTDTNASNGRYIQFVSVPIVT